MDLGLRGDVAVVTGGGRGLGAGIAQHLAQEGACVVVWDRDREPAERVAEAITGAGGSASVVVGDVCDRAQVDAIARDVLDRHGSVQILVNCAGFSRDAPIAEMTDEEWQAVIDVNLTAPFYVTRAFVPAMIERRYGRIVNISSRARLGDHNKCNYAAAKAGLVGFTAALALELGKQGITVNAVAPGFVETERVRGLRYYDDLRSRALAQTPTARLGELADVAQAVCYLAARQSGYVSGEVLTIAGGRLR